MTLCEQCHRPDDKWPCEKTWFPCMYHPEWAEEKEPAIVRHAETA